MSPEITLLAALARLNLTAEIRDKINRILKEGLNWELFLKSARFHFLVLLIFPHLKSEFRADIPDGIFREFEVEYNSLIKWNMFLFAEFIRLHKLLRQADIPVIAYKGAISAELIYGDLCRRHFYDIDLLISEEDFDKVYRIFFEQGFCPYQYDLQLPDSFVRTKLFRRLSFELALLLPERKIFVDLHWRIRPKHILFVPAQEAWLYSQNVVICGNTVKTFSPEMMLVSHCVSAACEVWRYMSWVVEVRQILETYKDLDWKIVEKLASPPGYMPMVLLGVLLAHKVLDTEVPLDILQKANKEPMCRLADLTIRCFSEIDWMGSKDGKTWLYALSLRDGLPAKIRYVIGYFTEPDQNSWLRIRLPECLFLLYYPLQIFWQLQGVVERSWRRLVSRGSGSAL